MRFNPKIMTFKNLSLIFIFSLFFISCETDQRDRPPTRLGRLIAPGDTTPIYVIPPCRSSLAKYNMTSNLLNFNTTFDFTSKVEIFKQTDRLQITITNSNNDELEFEFRTFVKGQSTRYNIVNKLNSNQYDCTLTGKINKFSSVSKMDMDPIPNSTLYVKFIGNNTYELVICDADVNYSFNGNIYTTDISFLLNMTY